VAERELAAVDQPAVRGQREQGRAHLVDAREPDGEALRDRLAHRLVEARLRGHGLDALDEALGGVDEEPGGLTTLVLDADAARRARRRVRDLRGAEGGR